MRDASSPTMQLKLIALPRRPFCNAPGLLCCSACAALNRRHRLGTSKLAAAISLVEPLRVLFGLFRPDFAAAAQRAGKIGWALFVECAATLLTVRRDLNQ